MLHEESTTIMPAYDYRCETCGVFTVMRRIADRDADCVCSECGAFASRTVSTPSLSLMPGATRAGHAVNERAAHAPKHSSAYRHVHGPGCGCSGARPSSVSRSDTDTTGGFKGKPSGRPWMISH
ncbi:MAG TPA: zinc ribbon domain-containing protein [Pararobbsia sp.]|jgi:putative FmdB family regulatory protein|nr:zinc ribbon domain-containing protein [Pararobbsia sp.]